MADSARHYERRRAHDSAYCTLRVLKTPYRGGTTHVIFEPLDFIARLAALVPKPGMNLTRFHGVFAPHSRLRSKVTPGGGARLAFVNAMKTVSERHAAPSVKGGV